MKSFVPRFLRALFTATVIPLYPTVRAEDNKLIAVGVNAVEVVIPGFLAMKTVCDHFFLSRTINGNSHAFVKNEEFSFPVVVRKLLSITGNSTVKLINVFKTSFFQQS